MIADVNSKHKPSDPDYPAEKYVLSIRIFNVRVRFRVEMLEEKSMKNVSYVLTWQVIWGGAINTTFL